MTDIKAFERLPKQLVDEILDFSIRKEIPKNTEILREGQYVKVVPIVISGLIKVSSKFDERELLLYYIKSDESCIMSFTSAINNEPSKIYALTEEDTTALLIPTEKINHWIKEYPEFNLIFLKLYNIRYTDLLDTINQVLFNKMDKRLHDYLTKKVELTNSRILKISHRQIANDLGTAREVISRVMKKLENENKVEQIGNSIKIL